MITAYLCIFVGLTYGQKVAYFKQEYFEQNIDHFNYLSVESKTFLQRYLYNASWWDVGSGPIFFYAGSEADIDVLWWHHGFVYDIAPKFRAFVLFAEHRYYGKSLPFGKDSFQESNIGYLSIEQALADYTTLIAYIKERFQAEECPVVVFGGSYGGMLAAYMRFKYPNVVKGAIASSAPIIQAAGLTSGELFFQAITEVFRNVTPNCEFHVRLAFLQMSEFAASGERGFDEISKTFRLCNKIQTHDDYVHLLLFIRNAFVYISMLNYPYATHWLPEHPVRHACSLLSLSDTPMSKLYDVTNMYYNSTSRKKCFDIYQEYIPCADPTGCLLGDNSKAWDYQACTQVNLEGGSNGESDMFPPVLPFTPEMRDSHCLKRWGILPRRDWLRIEYWGSDIKTVSNIVFSNGEVDPWTPGGVLKNVSDTVIAIMIEGGAHFLDLTRKHPFDPLSVINARAAEQAAISMFLGL